MNAIRQGSVALVLLFGGCSLTMGAIDSGPDGKQLPRCLNTHTSIFLDGTMATAFAGAGAELARSSEDMVELPYKYVAGIFVAAAVFTVSAATGADMYTRCRIARAEWHIRDAIRMSRTGVRPDAPSARNRTVAGTTGHHDSRRTAPAQAGLAPSQSPAVPEDADTYFCTSSPSRPEMDICEETFAACNRARRTLALRDGTACTSSDTAWCFKIGENSQCFGTEQACEFHAMATDTSGLCLNTWRQPPAQDHPAQQQ